MSACSILLVLLSVLATSFNLYKPLAKYGGAGALVPITGFANSVASPTIEYKKEGEVFGKGHKVYRLLCSLGHSIINKVEKQMKKTQRFPRQDLPGKSGEMLI